VALQSPQTGRAGLKLAVFSHGETVRSGLIRPVARPAATAGAPDQANDTCREGADPQTAPSAITADPPTAPHQVVRDDTGPSSLQAMPEPTTATSEPTTELSEPSTMFGFLARLLGLDYQKADGEKTADTIKRIKTLRPLIITLAAFALAAVGVVCATAAYVTYRTGSPWAFVGLSSTFTAGVGGTFLRRRRPRV
jgi:hypothetical protein